VILKQLPKKKVIQHNPGRRRANDAKSSWGLYSNGVTALCTTDILEKYVAKKIRCYGAAGIEALTGVQEEEEEEEGTSNGDCAKNYWLWGFDAGGGGEEFEIGW